MLLVSVVGVLWTVGYILVLAIQVQPFGELGDEKGTKQVGEILTKLYLVIFC